MSSYASSYPDVEIDPAIKDFFQNFYRISDDSDAHTEYVDQLTPDATLIMASRVCKGSEEILSMRKGLWEKVAARKHKPLKVFPFGAGSMEVMLFGTVDYRMKDDSENKVDWAARAQLVRHDGTMKMSFYQVYLDTAAKK